MKEYFMSSQFRLTFWPATIATNIEGTAACTWEAGQNRVLSATLNRVLYFFVATLGREVHLLRDVMNGAVLRVRVVLLHHAVGFCAEQDNIPLFSRLEHGQVAKFRGLFILFQA